MFAEYEVVEINGLTVKRRKTTTAPSGSQQQIYGFRSTNGTKAAGIGDVRAANNAQVETKMDHGSYQNHYYKTPLEKEVGVHNPPRSGKIQRSPNVEEYEISENLYDKLSTSLGQSANKAPEELLLALCSAVCEAELENIAQRNQPYLRDNVQKVLKSFLTSLAEATRIGSIKCAETTPRHAGMDSEGEDLHIDLEARKAGLRNRLQLLQEEEKQWNNTISSVQAIQVAKDNEPEEKATEEPHTSTFAAEEIQALKSLKEDLPRVLTQQIDGLEMVLKHMEEIVAQNIATVKEVKSGMFRRRFQPFQYINSPQKLIKIIAKPPTPTN